MTDCEVQACQLRFLRWIWAEPEFQGKYPEELNHNWHSVLTATSENRNSTRHIFSAWLGRGLFHLCTRSRLKQKSITSRDSEIGVIRLKITQVGRNLRRSLPRPNYVSVFISTILIHGFIGCCLRVRCYPSSIRQWNKILPLLFQVGADRGTNTNSLKVGLPLRQVLIFQRGSAKVWWSVSTLHWADVG